jgi:hypothetical protein
LSGAWGTLIRTSTFEDHAEGRTDFVSGVLPSVKIARRLTEESINENRYRFTLAHEYAHVRLHSSIFESGQNCFSVKHFADIDPPAWDWMEWQANYGAGALLMPLSPLRQSRSLVPSFSRSCRLRRIQKLTSRPNANAYRSEMLFSDGVVAGYHDFVRRAATKAGTEVAAFFTAQPLDGLYISVVALAEIRFGIELLGDPARRVELNDWLTLKLRPMFAGRFFRSRRTSCSNGGC